MISKLRSQYLELARREADWTPRYGANHLAVVNVRNQMRELQNSLRNELERIAETYRSDFEIAQQHEDSVQKQLDQAVSQSHVTNEAQVALRELESNAQTYRALYDNFLQRYMESVQQQSFPITEARVITAATPPLSKSKPKGFLVLSLATMVGLAFGFLAAAWRDFADRVFRTAHQVESILQTDCIAMLPVVEKEEITQGQGNRVAALRAVKSLSADAQAIAPVAGPYSASYSAIVDAPFSPFTEAIRGVKVAIDLSPTVTGGRIIRIHVVRSERRQVHGSGCGWTVDGADGRPDTNSRLRSEESNAVAIVVASSYVWAAGRGARTDKPRYGNLGRSNHRYAVLAGNVKGAGSPFQRNSSVTTDTKVL